MKSVLIAVAALLSAGVANATVIVNSNFDSITDPSFTGPAYIIIPAADGWTSTTSGIEIQHANVAGQAFSGDNLVELDTTVNSSMFLNLGAGHYSVSYYYSPRPNIAADSNGIQLAIGSTVLDSVALAGSGSTVWGLRTVDFKTSGGALTFSAIGTSDGVGGYLDSIKVASVPEASTWAMMVIGFGMVGFAARRRSGAVAA
jgi:hypothetical protein